MATDIYEIGYISSENSAFWGVNGESCVEFGRVKGKWTGATCDDPVSRHWTVGLPLDEEGRMAILGRFGLIAWAQDYSIQRLATLSPSTLLILKRSLDILETIHSRSQPLSTGNENSHG